MQWHNTSEFWNMGGYGLYVWGSFGLTAVLMLGEVLQTHFVRKSLMRDLQSISNPDESA